MKVKTKIEFFDKQSKKVRKPGDVFDVSPERFDEIARKGHYICPVEEKKPVKA